MEEDEEEEETGTAVDASMDVEAAVTTVGGVAADVSVTEEMSEEGDQGGVTV